MGAGHAREQKETGIGFTLVPEHKIAGMARSYSKVRLCLQVLLQKI